VSSRFGLALLAAAAVGVVVAVVLVAVAVPVVRDTLPILLGATVETVRP
jgi:hypothetical protein